jgi:predicted Ser/Thr protein kinase
MENIKTALKFLDQQLSEKDQRTPIPFETFLHILSQKPSTVLRNIFQVFYDMMKTYVGEGLDEYPNDPESINFVFYDCSQLFVQDSDHPFFADRLFANRLVNLVESLKRGTQQNKIYIFEGPPGSGKSTFLNNLLKKFEEYANTEEGCRFEAVWRLDRKLMGDFSEFDPIPILEKVFKLLEKNEEESLFNDTHAHAASHQDAHELFQVAKTPHPAGGYLEIPCPSHDHPILMIPKHFRRPFLDDMFKNDEFKWHLFNDKEFEWVFKDKPCTICSSLYDSLINKLGSPLKVFMMLYARPYNFNRRVGEGVSVFNPGDNPVTEKVITNGMLQRQINHIFRDSKQVQYLYSRYAKTNNGIYALMDIKSHNVSRLIELHNIISEGVHKVEDIEENVNSLFFALMNPEDKRNIEDIQSFSDRIEYIKIPYVLDLNTEIDIYRNIFGKQINTAFLPRVLHNFARVIIATRLTPRSEAMLEWIRDPDKYRLYCDQNLQLLKMEIYTGHIPVWLSEEDRKRFTAKRRKKIIAESEKEGQTGLSGRDSIKIFNEFYSTYFREDRLINMSALVNFFTKTRKDLRSYIPEGFLESLVQLYNYTVLQEVKESLYYYNEEQISRDIQNYIFAVNFEIGSVETCTFTGEQLEITDEFMNSIETRLLGSALDLSLRFGFRRDVMREYTTRTLPQEILLHDRHITETDLYHALYERYVYNLKEKVLDPIMDNENFRKAVKDFDEEDFKTYDKRIRDDVTFLISNLSAKFHYTQLGAREVCIYVIDNELAKKYNHHQ